MVKAKEPVAEEWYPVKLGSTCHDDATTRYYSLRYEFKPASIDNMRPGSLHNSAENKVTVEFFNNQAGKPKVAFQGNSEDCKELDAVLFFDGQSFRLERMHRAVKSLRHIRQPGESSAAANAALKETEPESPRENGNVERISTSQVAEKSLKKPPASTPIQIREKIESEEILPAPAKVDPPGKKKGNKKGATEAKSSKNKKAASPALPAALLSSPPTERKREREPSPLNIDIDDEGEDASPAKKAAVEEEQIEVEELVEELSEYEEVDISDDDEGEKTGVDQTAAALRAQAAENMETKASSSSSSSGSGSSESGSGSSSSDSGSDEEDSASSADDGDDI